MNTSDRPHPSRDLPRLLRARSRRRGVASVEALVVLPFFSVLFFGLVYYGATIVAQADAEGEARSCAWQYSMENCDTVPPGCGSARFSDAPGKASDDAVAAALSAGEEKLGGQPNGGGVVSVIEQRLGSALRDVFGRAKEVDSSRTVARPPLFGGRSITVTGRYRLACNLSPQTAESVADAAWKRLMP